MREYSNYMEVVELGDRVVKGGGEIKLFVLFIKITFDTLWAWM